MRNFDALESREPSILGLALRVTASMIAGCLLFLALGMTMVGWKVCCDLGSSEFTERDEAVRFVVEDMGPVWPFQSIEVATNNSGDVLLQRNWLGMSELQATIFNADHERKVAADNDLEPAFSDDAEWIFHNDYERGAGVQAKSAVVALGMVLAFLGLRFLVRKYRPMHRETD
jgi:hypothetical protein